MSDNDKIDISLIRESLYTQGTADEDVSYKLPYIDAVNIYI